MTSTIFVRSYSGVHSRTDLAVSSSTVSGQLSAEGREGGREGKRRGGGRMCVHVAHMCVCVREGKRGREQASLTGNDNHNKTHTHSFLTTPTHL